MYVDSFYYFPKSSDIFTLKIRNDEKESNDVKQK